MVHELGKHNSVLNTFLAQLRSTEVQNDRMRFRKNLERIGEIMAYEISKTLPYSTKEIITPLGEAQVDTLDEVPLLATILRAGLPFHQGFLNFFDDAENAFISAYRRSHKGGDFEIEVEYVSCPSIDDRILILADPMIATGSSVECVYKALLAKGNPKHIHIASVISSEQGLNHLRRELPENITLWSAAIDNELTAQSYIVPGLGDAGDLAYGSKNT
jgi:uracil phosphoribosyltransferase